MSYTILEKMRRAYPRVRGLLSASRGSISDSERPLIEEFLIFGSEGDALYIRGRSGITNEFKEYLEELKRQAEIVTPQNFYQLNPPSQPVQLNLDLEGRFGNKKESLPNNQN